MPFFTVVAVILAAAVAGCAPPPEQPILAEFFHASRLRDRTALQKLGTAFFDPATHGIVTTFDITGVVPGAAGVKDVSIVAPVKRLDGQVREKTLTVTIEQVDGRWLVTAVREAAEGPSIPRP